MRITKIRPYIDLV